MRYKFRFTKRNFYNKKEDTIEGFVVAKTAKEAEKKIHKIGLLTEVHLLNALIVKTEILINDNWIEIKP